MISKRLLFVSVFFIAFLVLATPFFGRFIDKRPLFAGGESYYNLRAADNLKEGVFWDSIQKRPFDISLFHYLLFLAMLVLKKHIFILPIILGLLSLYLLFLISKLLVVDDLSRLMVVFLFSLSPIFMFIYTGLTPFSFALLFFLAFVYLLLKSSVWSVVFFCFASITSTDFFVVGLLLMFLYLIYSREKEIFFINVIPAVVVFGVFSFFHREMLFVEFFKPAFSLFLISFGSKTGVAFFYLFLGVLGFFVAWKQTPAFRFLSLSFLIILVLSLFNPVARIMLSIYLCFFAALMIMFLLKRTWAVVIIKKFTLLLILCGIIFSTALYATQLVVSEPSAELFDALSFLQFRNAGVVLSHQDAGFFIEYFGDKKAFSDMLDDLSANSSIDQLQERMFFSRNMESTSKLFDQEGIRYVLVTSEMRGGVIWKKSDEGLLFLLDNAAVFFDKIYGSPEVEIWEYLPVNGST